MEELLKKLAKLSEEVGYKEIITSKIEINPSGFLNRLFQR